MEIKESEAIARLTEISAGKIAVSFSGGKDSLVALDLASRVGVKKVVFSNTTIEFPETVEYVEMVRDFYDIDLEIVTAPVTFFDMVEKIGFPSRRFRWCCEVFKFGPLAEYATRNKLYGFVTGLRNGESKRRSEYEIIDSNPLVPVKQINPIINWSDKEVWEYIKRYNLPFNQLYSQFDRIGCWCCPYKSNIDQWEKTKKLYPDLTKNFEEKLSLYAEKINIKNKKKFIDELGWTAWSSSLKKINIGSTSYVKNGDKAEVSFTFSNNNEKQVKRIIRVLPALTEVWSINGNKLQIQINNSDRQKLNVLIEKALNCVGCGACLSLCKYGALSINSDSIFISKEKCIHCKECLTSKKLRGGCIIRNYSDRRVSLIKGDNIECSQGPCTIIMNGKKIKTCEAFGHFYRDGYCFRCGKPENNRHINTMKSIKMNIM